MGLILAQTSGHPFKHLNSKATNFLLKLSIILLGFGMNLNHVLDAGKLGILFTFSTIVLALALGWLIGRLLKVEGKISYLISCGTAICGGSAIAAVSPIVKADDKQMSVSLGTVFILNALALFIFPGIGHWLSLTQKQFGMWAAIAIHDTSSVVGAAVKYGEEALQVATTVKLERALWIIPLSLLTLFFYKGSGTKIKIPWFIGLFILAMVISTFLPDYKDLYSTFVLIAKKGLTITLFLIGAGLSFETIKSVGFRPFLQGILLWVVIGSVSLGVIILTV